MKISHRHQDTFQRYFKGLTGRRTAGSLIRDEKLAQELKDTIRELRELTSDIRDNPTKYFKFSIF
jgi:hypothetical protein